MSDTGLHTVEINNSQSAATPVAFLHGFGGMADQWWGLQTNISLKAPTLSFDLPGHGKSVNFPNAGPPKVAARAVLAALDGREIDRIHIVGHSMGGAIASLIALMAPDRVASLTLLAPGGYGPEFNHPLLMRWAGARTMEDLANVMPQFFGPNFQLPSKAIEYQFNARTREGAVESLVKIATEMSADGKQGVLPVDDVISTGVPISVVWGTQDRVLPVEHSKQLEGRVDLHVVEDMGHSPAEEAPDLVGEIIKRQISS